jgi:hypothetical protein
LILSPDGKLQAQYSAIDTKNPERVRRLQAWRDRLDAVRKEDARP